MLTAQNSLPAGKRGTPGREDRDGAQRGRWRWRRTGYRKEGITGHAWEPEEERQEGDEKRQPQQRKRRTAASLPAWRTGLMKGAEGRCQREGAWNERRRGGKGSRSLRGRDTAERDAALFFLVRILARGCSLAGSILLGRELDPASFGLVSLVGAALSVPEAIGTLGLPDALAAAPGRDAGRERELAGTAFWWMLLGETGMAVLLLILAPFFARALHRENLTSLLRLSSLSLFATPWIRIISVQVQRRRQEEQGCRFR